MSLPKRQNEEKFFVEIKGNIVSVYRRNNVGRDTYVNVPNTATNIENCIAYAHAMEEHEMAMNDITQAEIKKDTASKKADLFLTNLLKENK